MRPDRKAVVPAATAILVAGLMSSSALVSQADATAASEISENAIDGSIVASQNGLLSSAAIKALRHLVQARGDIGGGDRSAAEHQLDEAGVLLDIVETTLPETSVRDRIWVARKHLEFGDTHEAMSDLVPIYRALDRLGSEMPVDDARRHLDDAKNSLAMKNKDKAVAQLEMASGALVGSEVDLPLRTARRLLSRARNKMEKGDFKAAADALKVAEDNVVFVTVAMHEPLAEANRSLWRAMQDYADGTYGAAKSEVRRAIGFLEYATRGVDEESRNAARFLVERANSVESKIETGSSDIPALLSDLWNRTRALSRRSVEYFSAGWQHLDTEGELKEKLIEAKLHLSYAESDRLVAKDTGQAEKELAQARNYLSEAINRAGQSESSEIKAVRDRIRALSLDQTEDQLRDRFAQAESNLANLIEAL